MCRAIEKDELTQSWEMETSGVDNRHDILVSGRSLGHRPVGDINGLERTRSCNDIGEKDGDGGPRGVGIRDVHMAKTWERREAFEEVIYVYLDRRGGGGGLGEAVGERDHTRFSSVVCDAVMFC